MIFKSLILYPLYIFKSLQSKNSYTFSVISFLTWCVFLDQIVETYSLHATHTVTTVGQYFICVVAYNRALEASEPVCSDGVTVTTAVPAVQEVTIEGARITGGLVTDSSRTNYWIVTDNRLRRLIVDPTTDCM